MIRFLCWLFLFMLALFILAPLVTDHQGANKTEYQKCMDAASHMRSDYDAKEWEQHVCRNAPMDPRDYK